jgi:hypothetical protein
MHGKRGREDAGDDQNFSAVEEWRAAAELKCLSADAKARAQWQVSPAPV